jgi:hypothetical protein
MSKRNFKDLIEEIQSFGFYSVPGVSGNFSRPRMRSVLTGLEDYAKEDPKGVTEGVGKFEVTQAEKAWREAEDEAASYDKDDPEAKAVREIADGLREKFEKLKAQWEKQFAKSKGSGSRSASYSELGMKRRSGRYESSEDKVGEKILQQMGGMNRIKAMTGSRIMLIPNGISLKFPTKTPKKGNYVEITLLGDSYEVSFYKIKNADKMLVKKYKDVYAEELVRIFEDHTGILLSLGHKPNIRYESKFFF